MIPKTIHYCWLDDNPIPPRLQKCIDSWKQHMPDYEIKRWSKHNFDIDSCLLVKEAYTKKKYAFCADYIRAYALYNEGGIYLDTDVMLYKSLEPLFENAKFVSAVEWHPTKKELGIICENTSQTGKRKKQLKVLPGVGILSAILCSEPNHPLFKDVLNFYNEISFVELLEQNFLAPAVYSYHAEKYGFVYKDIKQTLAENILIYSSEILSNYNQFTSQSYAVHWCAGSWTELSFKKLVMNWIKSNEILSILYSRLRKN